MSVNRADPGPEDPKRLHARDYEADFLGWVGELAEGSSLFLEGGVLLTSELYSELGSVSG